MNKNIKQLIERLFDDNDDILLDGIDTELVQNYKINIAFGNKISIMLTNIYNIM